jgi:septal ring factor EnvC (AmiA/AmiB activator)
VNRTLIALGLAILCCCPSHLTAQEQVISERDLKRLERSIGKMQKELDKHRGEHSSMQQQLKKNETAIGQLELRIDSSERTQRSLQSKLKQQKQQRATLQEASRQQEGLIAAQMRSAYQLGRHQSLKVLLNQQNPAQLARAMVYVGYFNRARMAQITSFSQTIEQLANVEADILEKTVELSDTLQTLDQQKAKLEHQQRARKVTLQQLASTIKSKGTALKQQQRDRDDLEKLLFTVEDVTTTLASSKDGQPFAARKGKMTWPTAGKRINRFGSRRSQGGLQWQGVEIQAGQGEPVRSIHQGRVLFADWFRGQGLLIIVDHGDSYLSLYSHNHSLLRTTGDWVNADEAIATVGASGGRQDNALYFEIRHKNKARDPAQWCSQ